MENGPSQDQVNIAAELLTIYKKLEGEGKKIADHWGVKNLIDEAAASVDGYNEKVTQGLEKNAKLAMDLTTISQIKDKATRDAAIANLNIDQELTQLATEKAKLEMKIIEARAKGDPTKDLEAELKNANTREKMLTTVKEQQKHEDMIAAKKDEMMKPMKDMQDKWDNVKANASAFLETIKTGPGFMAILTAGALALGAALFKAFMDSEAAIQGIYDSTGLTTDQVGIMREQAGQLRSEFAEMGMGYGDILKAQQALISATGTMDAMLSSNVERVGIMQNQFGLSADEAAGMLQTLAGIGDGTMKGAENTALMVKNLSSDAGVDAGMVMKDIAKLSGEALGYFAGQPEALAKAAVEARKMGLEIQTLTSTADQLLNLSDSLTKEMEAEMLIGRNLQLDKARQAAFTGDLVTMGKELLKQAGGLDGFNKMNVVQRKALAAAMGMSVEDMTKMLQKEEQLKNLTAAERKELDEIRANQEKITPKTFEQLKAEEERAVATEKFKRMMAEIWANIQESLLPTIEKIADWLSNWGSVIGEVIKYALILSGIFILIKGTLMAINAIKKIKIALTQKEGVLAKANAIFGVKGAGDDKATDALKPKKKEVKPPTMKMSMTDALKGAAAMLIIAAALWVMAKALQEFNTVEWSSVAKGAVGLLILAGVVFLLSYIAGNMILGAVAMLILSVALLAMGAALLLFNEVNWESIGMAAVTLLTFAGIAALLGFMVLPIMLGAYAIGILSAALMVFSLAALVLSVAGPPMMDTMERLGALDGKAMLSAASGIAAIGAALGIFGMGAFAASILSFFSADPVKPFERFAAIGPGILQAGEGIKFIAENVGLFSSIKSESEQLLDARDNINAFAFSLWNASGAMGAFAATSAVGGVFSGIGTMVSGLMGGGEGDKVQVTNLGEDFEGLRTEIKELRGALAGMEIKIDGKRAGEAIFSSTPGGRIG